MKRTFHNIAFGINISLPSTCFYFSILPFAWQIIPKVRLYAIGESSTRVATLSFGPVHFIAMTYGSDPADSNIKEIDTAAERDELDIRGLRGGIV